MGHKVDDVGELACCRVDKGFNPGAALFVLDLNDMSKDSSVVCLDNVFECDWVIVVFAPKESFCLGNGFLLGQLRDR